MRVPFLLRVPGLPNGGRVLTQPVSVVSLLPTLVELAGLEAPRAEIQAASLAPLLDAPAERELEPVFVEVDFDPRSRHHRELKTAHKKAIVTERFKLVRDDRSGQLELFDLARDPGETVNLAESRPALTRSLLASLEARIAHARGRPSEVQEATLSSELLELLRGLGYVESEQDANPP